MAYGLRFYWLYNNRIHSFKLPPIMKTKTTKQIRLIKFAIGILIGVSIFLLIKLF